MQALATITELGDSMLAAASNADWDEVLRLDTERQTLLATLVTEALAEVEVEARRVLEQALEITHQLLRIAREARASEAQALLDMQRGQRGAKAYLDSE